MTRPMLTSIRIRNLALIDDVEIGLEPGLTVLTGETGAGKSVIVGALSLVLGDRAAMELIRQGKDEGEVAALFHLRGDGPATERLEALGLAEEDHTLVVRRVLARSGRNRVYLNGRLATLSDLRRVVGPLVDISSQHAHTSLLRVTEHRELLDRFGDLQQTRTKYAAAFSAWREVSDALTSLLAAERDRTERVDLLRFQLSEIEELDPQPGEEAELVRERERLQNAEALRRGASVAEGRLSEQVLDALIDAERALRMVADADPDLAALADRVEASRIELDDVAMEARDYRRRVDSDPARLEEIEERIAALRRMMRKHGQTVEAMLARRDALQAELAGLEDFDSRAARLQSEVAARRLEAERAGRALTDARQTTARDATRQVEAQLAELGMPGAALEVRIDPLPELAAHGADQVELLLSANRGEAPLPLSKVASGGELSRIMLALKHVLASANTVDCYVFDEVDTGVSGPIADRIGVKLKETAARRQALCITHLPQVACHADQQLRVHKELSGGRTVTRVTTLDADERVEELARLVAGAEVTDRAREHAAELLANASSA